MEEIAGYKVAELRQALKDRGLPTTGTKSDLLTRLAAAMTTDKSTADDSVIDDSLLDEEDSVLAGDDDETPEDAETPIDDGQVSAKKVKLNRQPVVTEPAVSPTKIAITAPTEDVSSASTPAAPKETVSAVKVAVLSPEERAKLRQQRFGISAPEDKKEQRGARFGTSATNGKSATPSAVDLERLEKRRQRFGVETSSPVGMELARKKRAERFGETGISATPAATDDRKKLRAARFSAS